MKKLVVLLLCLYNVSFAVTANLTVDDKNILFGLVSNKSNVSHITNNDVLKIDSIYRDAKNQENHHIFSSAYNSYKQLVNQIVSYPEIYSNDYINGALPYLIPASYRLAVCAERLQQGKMFKLYDSLITYAEVNDILEDVLTFVTTLRSYEKIMISRPMYASLYYARAYNRVNLAYALVKGNNWKDYMVYMPVDISNIIGGAAKDMQNFIDFMAHNKVTIEKSVSENVSFDEKFEAYLESYVDHTKLYPHEYRMLQIMFASGRDDIIVSSLEKRTQNYAYSFLDTYYNKDTRDRLNQMRSVSNVSNEGISNLVEKLYNVIH